MKTPLFALVLALALPAAASDPRPPVSEPPRADPQEPLPPGSAPAELADGSQAVYTVEIAPFELEAGRNEVCRRMRATGNAFQPWNCESDGAVNTGAWLVSPDGERRLAIVTRVPGERWALEHLVKMDASGRALSFASYLHNYDPDKCFVSDRESRSFLELTLHGCSAVKIDIPGGTLYHRAGGPLSGGRFRADFAWLTTPQPSWGRLNSSVDIPASAIREFRLKHPVAPGGLREASLSVPDSDRIKTAIDSIKL